MDPRQSETAATVTSECGTLTVWAELVKQFRRSKAPTYYDSLHSIHNTPTFGSSCYHWATLFEVPSHGHTTYVQKTLHELDRPRTLRRNLADGILAQFGFHQFPISISRVLPLPIDGHNANGQTYSLDDGRHSTETDATMAPLWCTNQVT